MHFLYKLYGQNHPMLLRAFRLRLRKNRRIQDMRDIIFVAITIAFFLISIAYVKFCDRIR